MRIFWFLAIPVVCTRAKVCDPFEIEDKTLCGPALLVPAFGKCGTNALASYSKLHPFIKWTDVSEVNFDPETQDPAELVASHNPGVRPKDPYVWAVKCPDLWPKDPRDLAVRLRKAFPSARIVLTLCDPVLQPFRWFRHYLTQTLIHWPVYFERPDMASVMELQMFVQARHGDVEDLYDLFQRCYPWPEYPWETFEWPWDGANDCVVTPQTAAMLEDIRRSFFVENRVLSATNTTCTEGRFRMDTRISKIHLNLDDYILGWQRAGYVLNETLVVIVMESWGKSGDDYIRRLMRILKLDINEYAWHDTNGFRPVYSANTNLEGTGLSDVRVVQPPKSYNSALMRQCCSLASVLGVAGPLPWRGVR